jgi:hypothetical protein
MATKGQYQSFSLIEFEAILMQSAHVTSCRRAGKEIDKDFVLLNTAKHMSKTLLQYSRSCAIPVDFTENDASKIADWLMKNLNFNIGGSLESLAETTENN